MGFRSLLNQAESQALLRGSDDGRYWQAVLRFCGENDLQSVLDEYLHVLFEAEGLPGHAPEAVVTQARRDHGGGLSLRPGPIEVRQCRDRRQTGS